MRAARFALSVLKNRAGAVPRPSWATWLVTYRCNARCRMCDSWQLEPGEEMSAENARRVFREIGPLDVLRMTGGEPFLRQDLGELARAALEESRPRVVHVTTNGSFPKRVEAFAQAFQAPERLLFLVSFDGMSEVHDRNRGPKVSFALALETVHRLRAQNIKVAANHTVIDSQSMADGAALRAELARCNVGVQSVLAYAGSSMYSARLQGKRADALISSAGFPLLPEVQRAEAIDFVKAELLRARELPFPERMGKRYYLRGLLARLERDERPRPKPRCVALRSHLRLLPDGRVPVCQFNTETVGDLATQPFEEVWRGARSKSARAWVDACPGCWAECEVIPNAVYSADLALVA